MSDALKAASAANAPSTASTTKRISTDVYTRGPLPVAALQDELQELLEERFSVVPERTLWPRT
jgi:hypothetical protein